MWEWFSQTALVRHLPQANKAVLNSQRFWDHMDRIDAQTAPAIWHNIIKGVIQREEIDLSSLAGCCFPQSFGGKSEGFFRIA
jgi:hypothetical protein